MNPSQNIVFLIPSLEKPNLPFKLAILFSAIQKPRKKKKSKNKMCLSDRLLVAFVQSLYC